MTSFGDYLRASRLGYHWHEKTGAFIRVSAGGPPWRVDVRGYGHLPSRTDARDKMHVCWWEGDEDPWTYTVPLQANRTYFLGDDGQPPAPAETEK